MGEVIYWWFYNIAEPFSIFAGEYAVGLSVSVFTITVLICVLIFSKSYPFVYVMALSVMVGAIALIAYFPVVMFLPFLVLVLCIATCFIGICYMLHASVQNKPE